MLPLSLYIVYLKIIVKCLDGFKPCTVFRMEGNIEDVPKTPTLHLTIVGAYLLLRL
jgi:hypothetical protein